MLFGRCAKSARSSPALNMVKKNYLDCVQCCGSSDGSGGSQVKILRCPATVTGLAPKPDLPSIGTPRGLGSGRFSELPNYLSSPGC